MPPRGKESFVRRQKEIARQQKQKEKAAKREERRSQPKGDGTTDPDDLSPDDMISIEELTGLAPMTVASDERTDIANTNTESKEPARDDS